MKANLTPIRRKSQYRAAKAWKKRNPQYARDFTLRTKYGITEKDYRFLLRKQGKRCAICRKPASGFLDKKLAIDHNHKTGRVRGLLCQFCNIGIGHLRDDPALVEKALNYLKLDNEILIQQGA